MTSVAPGRSGNVRGNVGGACSGCGRVDMPLLMCDDLATENSAPTPYNPMVNSKNRYCAHCMLGKKVRVFWPLDEQWYVGVVRQYDPTTGEHLLTYPDGDTEWVRIGDTQANLGVSGDGDVQSPPRILSKIGALSAPSADSPQSRRTEDQGPPGSGNKDQPPPLGYPLATAYPPYPGHLYPGGMAHPYSPYTSIAMSPPRMTSAQGKKSPGSGGKDSSRGAKGSITPQVSGLPHTYSANYAGYPPGHVAPYSYYSYGGYPPPNQGVYPPYDPAKYAHPAQGGPPPPYGPYGHMAVMGTPMPMGGLPGTVANKLEGPPSGGKKKIGPKTWTKEEDAILLNMVKNMRIPMKWSVVAQSMPDRTGKQCRERYVNHLNPRLKVSDWNSLEDATIFYLYNSMGSQWAKMAKMIPGRTDNGIKNRFHNLRRQLEREDEHRLKLSTIRDFPDEVRLDKVRDFPKHLRGKTDALWNMHNAIGVLAAQSVLATGTATRDTVKKKFGPFRAPGSKGEQCYRCGLFVPSVQCGPEICDKTRWCQSCTRLPANLSGNLLRECLNLRKSKNSEIDKIVCSWSSTLISTPDSKQ